MIEEIIIEEIMIEEILVEAKQKLKRMFSEKIANFVEKKKRTDFINNLDCFLIHECGNIKSEANHQLLEGELYCAIVNYGSIEEILEFYTGVNVEFTSVDQLLNCVENKIVKHLNKVNDTQCQKLISDLVKKVNTMIYKWVVDNADANTQIHLDHLINTGAVLREVHNLGEVIMSELKNDKKSLGFLSFDDLSNAVKSHSLDCNFHCSLFGTIELNGVSKSCLADIESIPSQILFLVGDGGVGKTTHLSKFQQDMAKNDNVLPIYIPLFNKVNDDTIEKRIVKMYPNINGKSLSEESLREIFCSCQDKRHIVILLDGLNEYKGNNTVLFDNINDLCRDAIDLGYYFSINQQMLLSKNGIDVVDAIPLERILIESDAPFSRGLEHKYSYLFAEKVYDYLSDKRDIPRNEIPEIIKENFRAVLLDK